MDLTQNLWERFGFRDNPYDTRALSLSSDALLPIEEAFIRRDGTSEESRVMTNFFRNPGGGRIVVEGDVGVGKTTFVNYHRYIWETEAKDCLLTPSSEISVHVDWAAQDFLVAALGSLINRLVLLKGAKWLAKQAVVAEVAALTRVHIERSLDLSGTLTILGTGGGGGARRSRDATIPEVSVTQLVDYLSGFVGVAKELGFAGVTLHYDNLELLTRRGDEDVRRFFDDIRDILQTSRCYFVFVGSSGLFQRVIVPTERVRSIFFGLPVHLRTLTLEEVLQVLETRYRLLAHDVSKWIPPVSDELVEYLYELYGGRIRFIMDSIGRLVSHVPESLPGTISDELAKDLLARLARQKAMALTTPREFELLEVAARLGEFTNSQLSAESGMQRQNVNRAFKKLLDLNLVRIRQDEDGGQAYAVVDEMRLLGGRH